MGTSYSILYRKESDEYKVASAKCAEVNETIDNCKFYDVG